MVTKTFSLEFALNQNTAADVGVVIVAAGTATRMVGINKILAPIMGRPLIWHTILAFEQNQKVAKIVIVTRDDMVPDLQNIVIKVVMVIMDSLIQKLSLIQMMMLLLAIGEVFGVCLLRQSKTNCAQNVLGNGLLKTE